MHIAFGRVRRRTSPTYFKGILAGREGGHGTPLNKIYGCVIVP